MNSKYRILVVDDEPEMRGMISDYLRDIEGYEVLEARDGADALENALPNSKVDLVLSDINMPIMKGFELLKIVKEHYPETKRLLITAYNVEDYLELAMKHDVGNVLIKTVPLDTKELSVVIKSLLNNDIFGADKYFQSEPSRRDFLIRRGDALEKDVHRIIGHLPENFQTKRLELVLLEMLTNAVFYGIRKETPRHREAWDYDFELSEENAIRVSVFYDDQKCAVMVTDNGGRLKKADVLYWLYRQVTSGEDDIPIGMFDEHGRGFYIARKYVDRVIVNVARDRKTEIILMNYSAGSGGGYKPLYINEL